ncbi:MAG: hypothetical protein K2N06_09075 [Oscillospiraceae bacterium]|nr:hypothetical protein [Oscillospiraceae bacterium]
MKIEWKPEHRKVLNKISFEFDIDGELTDEQMLEIDDKVWDYLQMHGLGNSGGHTTVNPTGRICEHIIDYMVDCGA